MIESLKTKGRTKVSEWLEGEVEGVFQETDKKKIKRWIIEQKDQAGFPYPLIGVSERENREPFKWEKWSRKKIS